MDNRIIILLLGSIALMQWTYIWHRASRGPLGWASPTSLFTTGILVLYIIPCIYWQFRPWKYSYPPYFEGLPLVLTGAVVLGIPFLFFLSALPKQKKKVQNNFYSSVKYHDNLWVILIPILSGLGMLLYRISASKALAVLPLPSPKG